MSTIAELIDAAYTNWNYAERVGEIGMELEARTRLPLARKILQRAITLAPQSNPEWYISLAFANFRDAGRMSEDGERALTDGIETMDSDYLKATYIAFMEDEQAAEEMITQAHYTSDTSVLLALGYSLLWRGKTEDSLNVFRAAIKEVAEDDLPMGLANYCGAMCWMKGQGKDVELEKDVLPRVEKLIAAHPDRYTNRMLKIQVYQTLKDWAKVRDTALETLAVMPDEESTMVALGGAYEKLEEPERAFHWYSRAIGAKPSYVRARIRLGELYERRGDLAFAEDIFREIPTAFPRYTMGRMHLAVFLQRIGKNAEALQIAKEVYPRLKPQEKGALEQHPQGKELVAKINKSGY